VGRWQVINGDVAFPGGLGISQPSLRERKRKADKMNKVKVYRQLIINPGSASTKLAVFDNENPVFEKTVYHDAEHLKQYVLATDQLDFRSAFILELLEQEGFPLSSFDAVVGRGGLLRPMASGTYLVNERMKHELLHEPQEDHASNLGALIADRLASRVGVPAYIVDPVCTDELDEVARITGLPELEKVCLCHALNMKAVARKVAARMGLPLEKCNFVVAHLGSGISVSSLTKGRLVDVALPIEDGPFSTERCGGLPAMQLMRLCYSGRYTFEEMSKKFMRAGGMYAYLGTKDVQEAERRAQAGDRKANLVLEAMSYQIAKEIGAMATVLAGEVDRIIITGGIAHSSFVTARVVSRVRYIAPVEILPGEEELEALAQGGLRVLSGVEKAKTYMGKAGCVNELQQLCGD